MQTQLNVPTWLEEGEAINEVLAGEDLDLLEIVEP